MDDSAVVVDSLFGNRTSGGEIVPHDVRYEEGSGEAPVLKLLHQSVLQLIDPQPPAFGPLREFNSRPRERNGAANALFHVALDLLYLLRNGLFPNGRLTELCKRLKHVSAVSRD